MSVISLDAISSDFVKVKIFWGRIDNFVGFGEFGEKDLNSPFDGLSLEMHIARGFKACSYVIQFFFW